MILYQPLLNMLVFLVWLIPNHSVGIAIILLTIIIRFILLIPSAKAVQAQKQIQELQPEIDRLKEKYKTDNQAQSKAIMDLYQRNKINPLGSCLPLLIQLPILIVLYYVFRYGLSPEHVNLIYSFVPRPDTINNAFLGINLSNPSIYLAVAAGIFQFIQSKQMMPKQTVEKTDDKSAAFQKMFSGQMTFIMPIMTIIISMSLPAALALYWSVTSIFSIIQQWLILKKPSIKTVDVVIKERN